MDSPSSIEEVMYLDRMNDLSAKTKGHVYITPECGLCDQIIHANEWTVALLGNEDCLSPLYLTKKFRFPKSREAIKSVDKLTLCQRLQCKMCDMAHLSVIIHTNCYRVFQQSYHREGAMDPIWVASAWKFPWRHRPPQRKPRLDLTDTTLVSIGGPVAEAICIPVISSGDILSFKALLRRCHGPSKNPFEPEQDATRFSLAAVKAWKRGVQGMDAACDESESELFIVRLTVDCLGLKEIQRLQVWPEYNHIRSNTCAYVSFTQGQANSSFISSKFGRAFIENPHDSRDFQFCDT
ncbi:hypothetical protein H9L39_01896 [Fusarium oxysporum f. sp. albedinis]|nr:hypothetical protein H9L39_01896 [Fusarium oxysporum f. sp. albedinis]